MRKRNRRRQWNTSENPVRAAIVAAKYRGDPVTMQLQVLTELTQLRAGRIGPHTSYLLDAMATISEKLAARGIGPEVIPACQRVRAELTRIQASAKPPAALIDAASELYSWHEAQREAAEPELYARCSAAFCRISE